MKRFITKGLLSCMLSGLFIIPIQASTQVQLQNENEKSELLQALEMDAFSNPDIAAVPYEGKSIFKQVNRPVKENTEAAYFPITSNPALMNRILANREQINSNEELIEKFKFNTSWGTLRTIEDGKQYFFTQENEITMHKGYTALYRAADFTIYNDEFEELKKFRVSSMDTVMQWRISPQVSTRAFNSDSKWEFMVHMHGFRDLKGDGPIGCRDTVFVVNENSEVLRKLPVADGANLIKYSSSNKYHLAVYSPHYSGIQDHLQVTFYDPKKIGKPNTEMPEPMYTFKRPVDIMTYSQGPTFNLINIDGTNYYVSSYYEKPYVQNGNQQDPVWEKNNKFIVEFYDTSFNLVKTVKLPLIGQDKHELSMSSLAYFDKYMITKHLFNDDDKLEFVYGMSRYYVDCDCERTDFYLVNEDGEILKEMTQQVAGVIKLQDIIGQSDEYALLMGGGNAISGFKMFQMPEMKEAFEFPAIHNGELLSMSFNRVPVKDSYEYVFGLGRGESANNTVYGGIAYYDTTGKMTKRVRIDMGKNVAMFSAIIQGNTLNPYVFVGDEQMEYLYFAKRYSEVDHKTIVGSFGIANENEILYEWSDDLETGIKQGGAGVVADENYSYLKYLYVNETDSNNGGFTTTFINLPLKPLAVTGEGTVENPYKISNAAELELMRQYPSAYFELTKDIDMARQYGVAGNGFYPIEEFNGHLDGKDHVIRNVLFNKNGSLTGLFALMNNASVKNLQMENVQFSNYECIGLAAISGKIINSHIDNCHITTSIGTNLKKTTFGGLVGTASSNSTISNCSFVGTINAPNVTNIGGIVSKASTGTIISNCYTEGNLIGASSVAGITSSARTDAQIMNCYSTMNITGYSALGGILGMGNGVFSNNYATGDIICEYRPEQKWFNKAGGIAAEVTPAMQGVSKLENNVALNKIVTMGEFVARIAYNEAVASKGQEDLMINNYALSSMLIGKDRETAAVADENNQLLVGANHIHGQSVVATQLTQSFYEGLGWKFGKDSINPWVMNEGNPHLWFEFRVRNVRFTEDEISIYKGKKATVETIIYPEKAENKNVRYESSDMHVAIVSNTGEVTARNEGTAIIRAISEDGSHTAECKVTVIIPVEKVEISQHEVELYVREGVQLEATVTPDDATNKTIFWKSLNTSIAETSGGFIVGMKPGETQVVAIAEGGEATDTCKVVVFAKVEDMYLNESSISLDKTHTTFQLKAVIKPVEAANTPLTWSSEDENVAIVDQNGLVTAQHKGETIVSATTVDASRHADCLVIVTENVGIDNNSVQATAIYLEENAIVINSEAELSSVQLFNTTGQLIYNQKADNTQVRISTTDLAQGAYLIKITFHNGQSNTHKIVF